MLKVSFDFDSTLSLKKIKELVGSLDRELVQIYVVTSRNSGVANKDLWEVVELMGLDEEKVIFTDGGFKWSVLNHIGISIHFDDMIDEIMFIQANCNNTLGLLVSKDILGDMNYLSLLQPVKSIQVDNSNFE